MKENKEALEHVTKLIENMKNELSSNIKVEDIAYSFDSLAYIVRVLINGKRHRISFERSLIDDLDIALKEYRDTKYFNTLDSNIRFAIYIELGREGMLEAFNISHKLINDKREWVKNYRVNTRFDEEMARLLYEGLKKLLAFFDSLIEKHKSFGIDYADIKENKDWVQTLIVYYENEKHLNDTGVGVKNLQFLKAAAIMQIMHFEKVRIKEKIPSTLKALDKKIYDLVAELRKDPFLEIEPPKFIYDVAKAYD